MKPRLLDLFCGAGGAATGYARAGFDVVGVDIAPQKHYPFPFIQADALTFPLDGFDVIHASPPCQDYSTGAHYGGRGESKYPRLLAPMRERLMSMDVPWILENVAGAGPDMHNPLRLCGTALNLRVQRHRLFECSHVIFGAGSCRHRPYDVSVRCKRAEYLGVYRDVVTATGKAVRRPPACRFADAKAAMGVDWHLTFHELGEAIPPAYTEWLGRQLLAVVTGKAA